MDSKRLENALAEAFGGTEAERRAVARAAGDLADSGRPSEDRGHALTVPGVTTEHTILKTNMVIAGKKCPTQAGVQEVADMTVRQSRDRIGAADSRPRFCSSRVWVRATSAAPWLLPRRS